MHNRISTIIQARQEIQTDKNLIGYDLRLNADNFLVLKSVANWDMHSRYQKDKTEKLYKISGRLNSNTKVQKCTFSLLVGSNNYSQIYQNGLSIMDRADLSSKSVLSLSQAQNPQF